MGQGASSENGTENEFEREKNLDFYDLLGVDREASGDESGKR